MNKVLIFKDNKSLGKFYSKWILIPLFSCLAFSIILFIIATPFDLIMSDYTTIWTYNNVINFLTRFFSAYGYWLPFPIIFLGLGIIMEAYITQLKNNKNKLGKINMFFYESRNVLAWLIYIVSWLYISWFFINWGMKSGGNIGFGTGNSPTRLGTSLYTAIARYITAGISIIVISIIIFYLRFIFVKRPEEFIYKQSEKSFKILIFLAISFFEIFLVKHIMGRPAYFVVRYKEANPIDGWSMYDYMTTPIENGGLGWIYNPSHSKWKFEQADYFPWWKPNNPWLNMKYWFGTKPTWDPNNDQWYHMNFPSGHTTAATCLIATTILFDLRPKKIKWYTKVYISISFVLLLLMMLFITLGRFHWYTDVAWSAMIAFPIWLLAGKIKTKYQNWWINLYSHWYKNYTVQLLFDIKKVKNKEIIECYWIHKDKQHLIKKINKGSKKVDKKIAKIKKLYFYKEDK